MDAFEKGHLQVHVKNATDAKSAMEQIVKAIPKGFEHVFNGLAISLVVADTLQQVHNQDESKASSGDIAWNALK